ncbi:hypothetical protein A5656_14235 [Mycobacterium gordonae]|uniref:Uncharacterized protein n=1 Tax=Mycobacterium asiaticum TaxID=1790 RepID=A0A1A3KQC5_MYCAS|nr:hypothetical protein A5640_08040 [Mycobacterium asiaticum]OBK59547.1 hypothetical protein A5656_14235 [Mycobacterium gordonae]
MAAVGLSGRLVPAEMIVADELLKKLAIYCMPLTNEELLCSRITNDLCPPGQAVRACQDLVGVPRVVESAQVNAPDRGAEANVRSRGLRTDSSVSQPLRGWSVHRNVIVIDEVAGCEWAV